MGIKDYNDIGCEIDDTVRKINYKINTIIAFDNVLRELDIDISFDIQKNVVDYLREHKNE